MMGQRLYRIFFGPRSLDEDERRREYIVNVILVASIVMLGFLDGLVLYHSIREGVAYHDIPFGAFSVIPSFFVFLYVLSRYGYPRIASYGVVIAYFLSDSYAAYHWGVGMPVVPLVYALVATMAGVLVASDFAFVVAGCAAAFTIPVWYAQLHNLIPVQTQTPRTADAVVFVLIIFVITVVSWLSNREIDRSLERARTSEHALHEEREQLAVKVEERTEELKQAQFEKMQDVYRLAEFGEMASGLFHDLTNVVTTLLLVKTPAEPKEDIRAIEGRVKNFVESMRRQLRHENTQTRFSLNDGIAYAIDLLSYKARLAQVRVIFEEAIAVPYDGNPSQFHHVMVNLISNAIDAYCDASVAEERAVKILLIRKDNSIVISVVDRGRGISETVLHKIFEPFVTTKEPNGGMGIGLAIVKKIVTEDFQGTVSVESEIDVGSIFTVKFPDN